VNKPICQKCSKTLDEWDETLLCPTCKASAAYTDREYALMEALRDAPSMLTPKQAFAESSKYDSLYMKTLPLGLRAGDDVTAATPYVQVPDPEFVVYVEFEGRWIQADPFTFDTKEEAEDRITELRRYNSASFVYHVVKRTTIAEAVT
jgi:hypothetical protein